jgi:hypothetical protein
VEVPALTALKWDVEYELDRLDPAGAGHAPPAGARRRDSSRAAAGQPSFRLIDDATHRRRSAADAVPGRRSAGETRTVLDGPRPSASWASRASRVKIARRRRSGPVNPLRWAVVCTAFPAVLLVVYVALWTAAMRSGYHKQHIRDRIAQLKIENDSLQAQMRRLQSPRRIHHEAALLGMQPSEQVGYIFVPR